MFVNKIYCGSDFSSVRYCDRCWYYYVIYIFTLLLQYCDNFFSLTWINAFSANRSFTITRYVDCTTSIPIRRTRCVGSFSSTKIIQWYVSHMCTLGKDLILIRIFFKSLLSSRSFNIESSRIMHKLFLQRLTLSFLSTSLPEITPARFFLTSS